MAVNFIARKCACGGKLEFDSQKKIWNCKYCGTVIEREATFDKVQVDGIEGISDVVRQTLMDVANNKMESASRNLEDCERKNHKHIGTLIANISYNLSMISYVNAQDAAKGYLDKVKVYAKRLQTEFPSIAEDEINMYELFGDGIADVYANLLVVFDTLNDANRVEYITSRLRPTEIFSEHANKNLLKIALKRGNLDVAEAITNNTNHIDKKSSLQEILLNYPDEGEKQGLVEILFSPTIAESLSWDFFERYFLASNDSLLLKTILISKLSNTNLRCSAEAVVKALHTQMTDYDLAKGVFAALYETKISDQETEALLIFCQTVNREYFVLKAFLDVLYEKGIFVQLKSRSVISFLDSSQLDSNEKRGIVKKMFEFEIDAKSKDAIYNYYLNHNNDVVEERIMIIEVLMVSGCPISNNTVNNYIVKTIVDSSKKLQIIKLIFETGIKKIYLGDLLSEYLLSSQDSKDVKDEVSDFLMDSGFKVDSNVFTQYVTSKNEEINLKIEKMKKLLKNCVQIKADCLENYILSISSPDEFSEQVFNIIYSSSSSISINAYANFLLNCNDIDKIRHCKQILGVITADFNSSHINFSHTGDKVSGSVLHAYVLNSIDNYDVTKSIVSEMLMAKVKLNTDITVNGRVVKFKRYVTDKKTSLSPLALQICEENKMFSLF